MIWQLKKGSEKKFRSGHPWVFSNELAQSPKGLAAGHLVELQDHQGNFLARGYGHPNSLICFRSLSATESVAIDERFFYERLLAASALRKLAGVDRASHRLCFAEGDGLPGLVIDRYLLVSGGQAFVVQSSTAGMDLLLPFVYRGLELLADEENRQNAKNPAWRDSSLILANDAKSRQIEGINLEPKTLLRQANPEFRADSAQILIQAGLSTDESLPYQVDLLTGQKTGFFLDQRLNVQLASRLVTKLVAEKKQIRVLDLCCYVGQWGAQLAKLIKDGGGTAHVTCVDSSARALELAVLNVEANGGTAQAAKLDVVHALDRLPPESFDVVICDPPAFIKKKKDLPTGMQAYFKMNREAIRKTAVGGIYVSCSCSGLLGDEDFRSILSRVESGFSRNIAWIARGGHSPDHPQRAVFPQGTYLKAWLGMVR